jgi:hypothetical protein
MDIGKLFGHAWGLFRKDIGPLIVTTIVAALATGIPAAILMGGLFLSLGDNVTVSEDGTVTGFSDFNWGAFTLAYIVIFLVVFLVATPFYASMVSILVRRVREGRVAEYGDMFAGFHQYGQVVSVYLLVGLIVGLLAITIIGIPFAIYLGVAWVYALVIVVDRRLGFGEATGGSRVLVKGTGWWMTFLALFVAGIVFGIIGAILGLIPVIGAIAGGLLYPLYMAYLVAMYFQATGEVQLVENALAGLPPAAAGAEPYGAPPAGGAYVPPAPAAPPAGAAYAPPAAAPASPPAFAEGAPGAGRQEWAAAADPLAGQPPVAPPLAPAAGTPPTPPAPPAPPAPGATGEGTAALADEPHEHTASTQPGVDAESGRLVHRCAQCGTLIESSAEFCQVCAHQVGGGETPAADEMPGPDAPADDRAPSA